MNLKFHSVSFIPKMKKYQKSKKVVKNCGKMLFRDVKGVPLPNNRGGRNNRGGLAKPLKKIKRGGHNKRGGLENRQTF